MQLAIFGATGRIGRPLVQQALDAGHEVVALVRDPAKVAMQNEHLTLVQGDAMQLPDVERTVQGADAVICVLGHRKDSPKDMQTIAARNIVQAMCAQHIQRLVSLTGAGVEAPQDRPKLSNHLIKFALLALSGDVYRDGAAHARVIQESPLDWVIARGPRLTEGPHTGTYRVGWVGVNTGMTISRADVADFLLKQTTDTRHLRQMPMISD
ncbi:MAG TPA: SDR family oxidoreductase [Ktedonobacterales bacterium]|jgi:putative NADH-flavin reductase